MVHSGAFQIQQMVYPGGNNIAANKELHPDTIAYRDAIIAAGGTIDDSTLSAIDTNWTRPIITAGLKSKCLCCLPFCGNSLVAAAIAFWGNNITLYNFVGGDYSQGSGLQSDGVSKYGEVFFPAANTLNVGYSLYASGVNQSLRTVLIGWRTTSIAADIGVYDNFIYAYFGSFSAPNVANSDVLTTGLITSFSEDASNEYLYFGNTKKSVQTADRSAGSTLIGGINLFATRNFGSPALYSSFAGRFCVVWQNLTSGDIPTIATAITNLQTALGRA